MNNFNQNLMGMLASGEISEKEFFGNKPTKKIVLGEVTEEEKTMILNAFGINENTKQND